MKAYLSRRYHFVASHRLHAASLSDEANRATFGKCNNPFGHGHNYTVEVCFSGAVSSVTGMVANLPDLDRFVDEQLIRRFDHTNLNVHSIFADLVPTTENLTVVLHRILVTFPHARLERVHVEETSNNSFEFGAAGPFGHGSR